MILFPSLREILPHFSVLSLSIKSPITHLGHERPEKREGSEAADVVFQ